jgi:Fe2+ or Zn2+ uptake regulation protein
MNLITTRARAYVNFGRWVAECPYLCGSAMQLEPHETHLRCTECLTISEIEWPPNADEIWQALEERRAPRNRNWFPAGHELALRAGCPHGQTVEELRQETRDHEG